MMRLNHAVNVPAMFAQRRITQHLAEQLGAVSPTAGS
jgi:hypothetical protein